MNTSAPNDLPPALNASETAAARVSPAMGLVIVIAVVAVLAVFLVIAGALGITDTWVAFLFLLYWSGFEHGNFKKLPDSTVGAVCGLALAWGLLALPAAWGTPGGVLVGVAILAAIYCLIVGWIPLAVNYATMLFLTVGTVPAIQAHTVFATLIKPLAFGIVFFAGLAWVLQTVMQSRAKKHGQ